MLWICEELSDVRIDHFEGHVYPGSDHVRDVHKSIYMYSHYDIEQMHN